MLFAKSTPDNIPHASLSSVADAQRSINDRWVSSVFVLHGGGRDLEGEYDIIDSLSHSLNALHGVL